MPVAHDEEAQAKTRARWFDYAISSRAAAAATSPSVTADLVVSRNNSTKSTSTTAAPTAGIVQIGFHSTDFKSNWLRYLLSFSNCAVS